ncbi:MAG: hypothetical protein KR126chlam1_01338 [Chlamydiae bacterium]|nr:hypothetical protein [Chlamydiota bacterium]
MSDTLISITPSQQAVHLLSINGLKDQEQCQKIEKECTTDARYARMEAFGKGALAVVGVVAISLAVAKLAAWMLAFVIFPLKLLPGLFGVASTTCEVGAGVTTGYLLVTKGYDRAANAVADSWNRANESYEYAAAARAKASDLRA